MAEKKKMSESAKESDFQNLGPQWYVVHTYSGYESKVKASIEKIKENKNLQIKNKNLQNEILEIKIPTEIVEITTEKGKKEVEEKIFPGYVFVKMIMSEDNWHIIRNITGATGFTGPGSKPVPLEPHEVEAMGVEIYTIVLGFEVGDSVSIAPAAGLGNLQGVVVSISDDKKTAVVNVNMFGRETPMTISTDALTKIKI